MVKPKILVIEDDAITASNSKRSLEQLGYEVLDSISSDMNAIDISRKERPELVLMGVDLDETKPGMETARQIYHQLDIPIVCLLARSNREDLQSAIHTEPFIYILKPFTKETLLVSINTALRQHQAEKALKESQADLKAIFNSSLQIQILVDRNLNIRIFNKAASERMKLISGRPIERGRPVHELVSEEDRENFEENVRRVLQGETVTVVQRVMSKGKNQWLHFYFSPVFNDGGQITGFCINSVDSITMNMTAELLSVSEQRLLSEIQSVLFTTEELVNNANLENLLDFVTTQARHLTNADGVAALLRSNDRDNLKVVSVSSPDAHVKVNSLMSIKGSIAETVLTTHKTQFSSYPQNDQVQAISQFLSSSEINSLLCAPLKVRDKTLGLLLLWSKNNDFFKERDTPIIHLFASQVALALYSADLHIQNRDLAIKQERHRLARELHDSVTQSLYSIGMAAQAALRYTEHKLDYKAKKSVELINALSQTALAEIRTNLYELQFAADEKRLDKALKYYCDSLEKQFGFKVDLRVDANITPTGSQVEHLYYVTKEALWNIVKHAHINQAKVVLTKEADDIILMIEDKGVGFIYPPVDYGVSMGLRNLKERAELLDGSLTVQTKPGWGTQITVRIHSN